MYKRSTIYKILIGNKYGYDFIKPVFAQINQKIVR